MRAKIPYGGGFFDQNSRSKKPKFLLVLTFGMLLVTKDATTSFIVCFLMCHVTKCGHHSTSFITIAHHGVCLSMEFGFCLPIEFGNAT